MSLSTHPDVLIVGGGIWGLATALHLRMNSSASVRLIERNSDFAQETTINAAGQVGQIRPSPIVTRAIAYGLDLFESFPTRFGVDAGLVRCGSLFVAQTVERIEYFQKQIARGRANGLTIDSLKPAEMKAIVPGLAIDGVLGGYFVHGDGYLDACQAARALAAAASSLGADLRRGVVAREIILENGRAVGVQTNHGTISAGAVIVTAGPWSTLLVPPELRPIPVQAIRHQRIRTERYASLRAHHPVLRLPDLSSYVRPENGGLTFGHFEDNPTPVDLKQLPASFRSIDLDPPLDLMRSIQERIARVYPDIGSLAVKECCRAMITFAPDGAYAVGPVPNVSNLYVASGCAALGIAGSAAIGRWLADWALGRTPPEDLSEFSLDRFGDEFAEPARLRQSARDAYASYYRIKP
jgi:4-methylaminobutanoate oxidase (formaldehyde-forming)